jgi:hypothetical protein
MPFGPLLSSGSVIGGVTPLTCNCGSPGEENYDGGGEGGGGEGGGGDGGRRW